MEKEMIKEAIETQIRSLEYKLELLRKFDCCQLKKMDTIHLNRSDMNNDSLKQWKDTFPPKDTKCLYFFKTNEKHFQIIKELFPKVETEEIAYSMFNEKNESIDSFLYVGSSSDMFKRFKEHCGIVSKGTYALRFNNWLENDIDIEFQCYYLVDSEEQAVLQNIEDGLWKLKKPLFGKLGGINTVNE
jgi:hypothetical protein